MRFRTAAAAALALTLLTSCGSSAGSTKEKSLRIATEDQIRTELTQISDRVYAALGVKGKFGESDDVNFSLCASFGDQPDIKDAIHFWQVDDLDPAELNPAIERLRDYLKANGWTNIGEGWDADHVDREVWGKNPENTAAIKAEAFTPKNRLIFQVSTPCFKIPAA